MITTIIVEDELWACQLIKRVVNWQELGFSIIGEAHDGFEAFELIKTKKPDLVITDIRMPGLDGISLIKNIKENELDTNFIIISGYSDFEYAKSAIKYGALGYLLKPIDKRELMDLLTSVSRSVFSKREKMLEEEQVRRKLTDSLNQLKEQFFLKLLLSDTNDTEKIDFDKLNHEYGSSFRNGCFEVAIFKIDRRNNEKVNEGEEAEILNNIQRIISSQFQDTCLDIVTLELKNQVICILNYHSMKGFIIRNSINVLFGKVKNNILMMSGYDVTVGIGSCETDLNLLQKSYSCAQDSIKARVILGVDQIIDISKYKYSNVELRELFPLEKEMKLSSALEVFDIKSAEVITSEILHTAIQRRDVSPNAIFEVVFEIVEVFYKAMRRIDIGIEKDFRGKDLIYTEIQECKSMNQIIDCFTKLFGDAKNFYNSQKQSHNRKAIEVVKAYIGDHFREDISLNDVANLVFLNSKYLGELFKKETGINFSDYVINYRIDAAKELLKDIKFKTNEVAELVGYKDAKHFSKLFKKIVGVNPAEYKKMFS